jgi:myosin heavy subunit
MVTLSVSPYLFTTTPLHYPTSPLHYLTSTEDDKITIFSALKAVLLLGNIDFSTNAIFLPTNKSKAALVFQSSEAHDIAAALSEESIDLLMDVSDLLGVPMNQLRSCLLEKTLTIRSEITTIPLDLNDAQDNRDALAKEIYARLFSQIVAQVNQSLTSSFLHTTSIISTTAAAATEGATTSGHHSYHNHHHHHHRETKTSPAAAPAGDDMVIGLLDIFGFEKFKSNSFEQLCINYANEKLQQYFVSYVFKHEQQLYVTEGIPEQHHPVIPIDLIDNIAIIQLLEGRPQGLFSRLDDELKLPKSSDENFLRKVDTDHNAKQHSASSSSGGGVASRCGCFMKEPKMPKLQFEVRHFAGVIRYDAKGFLEKNRDKLNDELEDLLASSTKTRFREIMTTHGGGPTASSSSSSGDDSVRQAIGNRGAAGPLSSSNSSRTLSSKFQSQLSALIGVLELSQPHFIKCIKTNNMKGVVMLVLMMMLLVMMFCVSMPSVHFDASLMIIIYLPSVELIRCGARAATIAI